MGLHSTIIRAMQARQERARRARRGPIGDFHRAGGDRLLHDLPVATGDVVVDAGGFGGDWTAAMLERFGCSSELYEPVPEFADRCIERFSRNSLVRVHREAIGGACRTARFRVDSLASSEFAPGAGTGVEARMVDVRDVVEGLVSRFGEVACLKLNIEGGEYEVLERLVDAGLAPRCRSILVQFHAQPAGWEARLAAIERGLRPTHAAEWRFPMIWEKWVRR